MEYKAPPGVFDIVPHGQQEPSSKETWRSTHLWQEVERVARTLASRYGFSEIRTPIFEKTELLCRGVGEGSDIVSKEMYTFEDRGGRSLTLRPEGTAPVVRALIENQLLHQGKTTKVFYIGPMFRYERSQAGRYRQHHQFGVEAIGCPAPEQDAELIDMLYTLYRTLGLKNLSLYINSIGTPAVRKNYREALVAFFRQHETSLSTDSKARLERNPLRILDSKDPGDQKILAQAPTIHHFFDEETNTHFSTLQKRLDTLKIPYTISPLLVRGLDYYNKTVFEITSGDLGAQNSLGGGGRYDGLVSLLGGPDMPAAGFGTGIERILQAMIAQQVAPCALPPVRLLLIPMGEAERQTALLLQQTLRTQGYAIDTDWSERKLGKRLADASTAHIPWVAIIGDNEQQQGVVSLKEMATGATRLVPWHEVAQNL